MINKVVKTALVELGYVEGQNNLNKYAPVVHHANHQAWCATFLVYCFKMAGASKAIHNSASVLEIANWGKTNKLVIDKESAIKGDLILLDFTGDGKADHIELAVGLFDKAHQQIKTIGGNTGSVSQSNGDGVYLKQRQAKNICLVIRPDWSKVETEQKN